MNPIATFLTNPSNESARLTLAQKLGGLKDTTVLASVPIDQQIAAYGQVISHNFGLESQHRFDVEKPAGYNQARELLATGVFDMADKREIGAAFISALRGLNPKVAIPATWAKDSTQAFEYVKLMAASHSVQN